MRLMAHLSGDPDLLKVFTDGGDVFRRIAAALRGQGKKAADITEEERRQVTYSRFFEYTSHVILVYPGVCASGIGTTCNFA